MNNAARGDWGTIFWVFPGQLQVLWLPTRGAPGLFFFFLSQLMQRWSLCAVSLHWYFLNLKQLARLALAASPKLMMLLLLLLFVFDYTNMIRTHFLSGHLTSLGRIVGLIQNTLQMDLPAKVRLPTDHLCSCCESDRITLQKKGGFNYAAVQIPRGLGSEPPTNEKIAAHVEILCDSKDFR